MKAKVTVRTFVKGTDEPALVELMNAEYREYASWWRGATVEEILELEKNPSFSAAERLIAEVGGKPAGLVHARVEQSGEERRGFIRDFCVLPSFRGSRVEEKLLEAAVTEFKKHGIKQVRTWTGVNRTDRIEFLERSGFKFSHRTIDMRISLEKVPSSIGENTEVTVRPVEVQEAKEVEKLNWLANTCFKDDPLYVPETVEETRSHVDKSVYWWQKFFFAVLGNRDVGYVGLGIDEKYNVEHDVKTGFVTWIGVLPAYRRRGIGTRLLLHSFNVLKAEGMTSASLDTEDTNPTRAITMYEKVGFKVLQEYVTYAKDMAALRSQFRTVDEFIASFPKNVRDVLEELRRAIRESAPEAKETISYGIPTFDLKGRHLVHFSAYKNHVGFYPTSSGIEAFRKELSSFKTSRGTVQFPLDRPIPFDLVRKIVKFRVKETESRKK